MQKQHIPTQTQAKSYIDLGLWLSYTGELVETESLHLKQLKAIQQFLLKYPAYPCRMAYLTHMEIMIDAKS